MIDGAEAPLGSEGTEHRLRRVSSRSRSSCWGSGSINAPAQPSAKAPWPLERQIQLHTRRRPFALRHREASTRFQRGDPTHAPRLHQPAGPRGVVAGLLRIRLRRMCMPVDYTGARKLSPKGIMAHFLTHLVSFVRNRRGPETWPDAYR
jgi:hypothetical protein